MARDTHDVERTVEQIRPLLAGRPPEVQSAILADLLAYWLAGHHCPGDIAATGEMRAFLLEHHLELVRTLTRLNAQVLGTTPSEPE